ncbi:MAG: lipid-binding SYLF domain-containing protein [Gemmatimonadota bacterium]|nr:lipid-binding SYLF domain-containing protein [Gemmatimonadota bacterium]
MKTTHRVAALAALAALAGTAGATAQEVREDVTETIETFKSANESMSRWFEDSHAYAVFPNVGKGGLIVGAGHGTGQVFRGGALIGEAEISMLSVGLQIGGQEFSEVVFFQNAEALGRLTGGKLEFGAGMSAIAVNEGASTGGAFRNGLAVFTRVKGGAMVEASVNGQKFDYKAYD